MANSKIQIKRSTSNNQPSTLFSGELAYSYTSNTLFIGLPDNAGHVAIGGQRIIELANLVYNVANAAYDTANAASAGSLDATSRTTANAAYDTANLAFDRANTANLYAAVIFDVANGAYDRANTANTVAATVFGVANGAYDRANTANVLASVAFDRANTANGLASQAFDRANTKLDSAGGTLSGDLNITGNLIVSGETTKINTTISTVVDPLMLLANNNTLSDTIDLGLIAKYANTDSDIVYTGVMRDATTKEWYMFHQYDQDPSVNNHINPSANNFQISMLNAGLRTSNLILGGVNAISWLTSIFSAANSAFDAANNSNSVVRSVALGGTGNTTFTVNGMLFGNGTSSVLVTDAGIEGQVLMAGVTGIPIFQDLNGGEF